MIIHACVQGTEAWLRLRMGRPTASQFHRIITPTGKPSASADDYVNELLGELMLGRPLDKPETMAMVNGSIREPEARAYYEFLKDCEVQEVGFCTTDDGRVGASPDGLVGDRGLLELKGPEVGTHVGYLLGGKTVDKKYYVQAQGQLYVAAGQRDWVDVVSYFQTLPHALVRVERNEEFQKLLHVELQKFLELLEARREKLEARGWIKQPEQRTERSHEADFISDADLDAILEAQRPKLSVLETNLAAEISRARQKLKDRRADLPVLEAFPDSGDYRPGEEVNVQGVIWMRALETSSSEWEKV